MRARAVSGAVIGTEVTNASGVATQPFTFTLPGNYTIIANVSNSDTTQYGIASTSTQTYVLDQSTLTLNTAQNPNGSATVTARPARRRRSLGRFQGCLLRRRGRHWRRPQRERAHATTRCARRASPAPS